MPFCYLKEKKYSGCQFWDQLCQAQECWVLLSCVKITTNNCKCIIYLKWAGINHGIETDWLTDWLIRLIGQWLLVICLVHSLPSLWASFQIGDPLDDFCFVGCCTLSCIFWYHFSIHRHESQRTKACDDTGYYGICSNFVSSLVWIIIQSLSVRLKRKGTAN